MPQESNTRRVISRSSAKGTDLNENQASSSSIRQSVDEPVKLVKSTSCMKSQINEFSD